MSGGENSVVRSRWRFGPGLLVTAAFIGPGTVATASRAGAEFGFALLWALLFAVFATLVLQEMAARLGLVTRLGLAEAMRQSIQTAWLRQSALLLVLTAIVFGNTAYQTGNLLGAGMGIEVLTGVSSSVGAVALGLSVAVVLALGRNHKRLQATLIGIVLAMSVAFLATAAVTKPDVGQIGRGLLQVSLPTDSLLTVLALIGTTVVPYNLFLHASTVQQRWPSSDEIGPSIREARIDAALAITLGGLVTMAIVATAASAFFARGTVPDSAGALAEQLEPLFGSAGKYLFAFGLAAAGITSAITAPLAAGYAAAGTFPGASPRTAKATAVAVALIGSLLVLVFGKSPQATIVAAQAANGLFLPFVAVFLLLVMNRSSLLGRHCNNWAWNIAGGLVVIVACALGVKSLVMLIG